MAYFCHTVNQWAETAGRNHTGFDATAGCRPAGTYHLANHRAILCQKGHGTAERHHRRFRDLTKIQQKRPSERPARTVKICAAENKEKGKSEKTPSAD